MKIKNIVACILAIVMLCAFCGCTYNPTTVGTVDDYDIAPGLYLYLQFEAFSNVCTENGITSAGTAEFIDSEVDGVPVKDLVFEETLETCKRFVFTEKEFDRLGLSFAELDENIMNYYVEQMWSNYSELFEKNGIGHDTYAAAQTNYYKYELILETLYGEGGEFEIPADELKSYYEGHFNNIDYIEFPTADGAGTALSEDTIAALSDVATDMLAAAKETDSLEQSYLENYDRVYEIIGSDSVASKENFSSTVSLGGVISDIYGSFDADFATDALGVAAGDYGLFNNGTKIYLYKSLGIAADSDYSSYLTAILSAMAADPFEEYVKSSSADYPVNIASRAKNFYSISKIVLQ